MSCFIYGYLEYPKVKNEDLIVKAFENIGLGLIVEQKGSLYNFPTSAMPSDVGYKFYFTIGTDPGTNDSTYLTWDADLDPFASGSTPFRFQDRLLLIGKAFDLLIEYFDAYRMAVAITDSCEIAKVVQCKFSELKEYFMADCNISCPPDVLYVATL